MSFPSAITKAGAAFAACVLVLWGMEEKVEALCGIEWRVPGNHFDGISETGGFSYWRDAGMIDLGDGFKIPLVIGFKPARGGNSWLGPGWIIPLLESNVIQVDEKKFLLTQPDGILRQFWRKTDVDTVLKGQGGWAGMINNNNSTVTLWAECGWKLVFTRGKITSITDPQNRVFSILYTNGRPMELRERGRSWLKVEADFNGNITGLTFGQNRVLLKMGSRPRVDVLQGANVIGGTLPALQILTLTENNPANNKQTNYVFSTDEEIQPTLHISGEVNTSAKKDERFFTWNAATGRLIKDGDWTYKITPGKEWWMNVETERINGNGQREFWFEDKINGREIITTLDGVTRIKSWYTSGGFSGLLRQIEEGKDGKLQVVEKNSYDEQGRLTRQTDKFGIVKTWKFLHPERKVPANIEYEVDNDSEHMAIREAMEKNCLDKVARAKDQKEKDEALLRLAYLYLHTFHQPEKAVPIIAQIQGESHRFRSNIHMISWNHKITPMEKLAQYQKMALEYPGRESNFQNFIECAKIEISQYKKDFGIR